MALDILDCQRASGDSGEGPSAKVVREPQIEADSAAVRRRWRGAPGNGGNKGEMEEYEETGRADKME